MTSAFDNAGSGEVPVRHQSDQEEVITSAISWGAIVAGAKVEPAGGGLGSGRISRLSTDGAQLVCLSYLDADLSTAGARFVVRRLRRRLGEIKILAGFWQSGPAQASELCAKTKADFCATSFKDAVAFCRHEAVEEAKAGAGKSDAKPAAKTFAGAAES
jgi:hypothetical protein